MKDLPRLICPVCYESCEAGINYCSRCGWEFRLYETPLTGDFLIAEKERLEVAKRVWDNKFFSEEAKKVFSYGFLVSYQGKDCVSNMILLDEPAVIVKEWPVGKFVTQVDGQSEVVLQIYKNQSNERIVPVEQCDLVMKAAVPLDTSASKGTPILVKWERDKDFVLFVTVSCLNKTTIIRIGG